MQESLINPSAQLSPGFGVVTLELKNGETSAGFLEQETTDYLILKQGTGETDKVLLSDIEKRTDIPSSMPSVESILTVREIRDMIAFLAGLKDDIDS